MFTTTCPHTGCGKSFTRDTASRVKATLWAHYRNVHKKKISRSEMAVKEIGALPPAMEDAALAEEKPARKKYTKKSQQITVNHCPQCGCNIQAVALAMSVAGRM